MKKVGLNFSIIYWLRNFNKHRNKALMRSLPILAVLGMIMIPTVNFAKQIIPDSVIVQKQNNKNVKESVQVALSEFVLVSLKEGGITSGDFINLNDKSLIIAFGGFTQGIPLSNIKTVEFQQGVWIPANDTIICQRSYKNCHKFTERTTKGQKTWSNIPITNFNLAQGSRTALLELQEIVKDEDWQDLIDQSNDIVYVVDQIEMQESGKKMTIKATPIARKK